MKYVQVFKWLANHGWVFLQPMGGGIAKHTPIYLHIEAIFCCEKTDKCPNFTNKYKSQESTPQYYGLHSLKISLIASGQGEAPFYPPFGHQSLMPIQTLFFPLWLCPFSQRSNSNHQSMMAIMEKRRRRAWRNMSFKLPYLSFRDPTLDGHSQ